MSITLLNSDSGLPIQGSGAETSPITIGSFNFAAGSQRAVVAKVVFETTGGVTGIDGVSVSGGNGFTFVAGVLVNSITYIASFILLEADFPDDGTHDVLCSFDDTGGLTLTGFTIAELNNLAQTVPTGAQVDTDSGQNVTTIAPSVTTLSAGGNDNHMVIGAAATHSSSRTITDNTAGHSVLESDTFGASGGGDFQVSYDLTVGNSETQEFDYESSTSTLRFAGVAIALAEYNAGGGSSLVNKDANFPYEIFNVVGGNAQLLFELKNTVLKDSQFLNQINNLVLKDTQFLHRIKNLVSDDLQSLFRIRELISSDFQNLYGIKSTVNADTQLINKIRNLAAAEAQILYQLFESPGASLELPYSILNGTLVSRDLQALYAVSQNVGASIQAPYVISQLAGSNVELLNGIKSLVNQSQALYYKINGLVLRDVQMLAGIKNLANSEMEAPYKIKGLTASDMQMLFSLSGLTGSQLALLYRLASATTGALERTIKVAAFARSIKAAAFDRNIKAASYSREA